MDANARSRSAGRAAVGAGTGTCAPGPGAGRASPLSPRSRTRAGGTLLGGPAARIAANCSSRSFTSSSMSSRWAGVNERPATASAPAISAVVTGRTAAPGSASPSGGAPGAGRCTASGAGSAAAGRAASDVARKRRRLDMRAAVGRRKVAPGAGRRNRVLRLAADHPAPGGGGVRSEHGAPSQRHPLVTLRSCLAGDPSLEGGAREAGGGCSGGVGRSDEHPHPLGGSPLQGAGEPAPLGPNSS